VLVKAFDAGMQFVKLTVAVWVDKKRLTPSKLAGTAVAVVNAALPAQFQTWCSCRRRRP